MGHVEDRWVKVVGYDGNDKPIKERTVRYGKGLRYRARYEDPDGNERSKSFRRLLDANNFLSNVEADKLKGTYIDPDAGRITLRKYGTEWLSAQTFDESTRESVELRLRLHVFDDLGDKELRNLRPSMIQAWARGLQGRIATSYVRTVFANLSSVLSAAVDDGLIAKNPCQAGSVKPPPPDRRQVIPWPLERVAAVRAAVRERYRASVDLGSGLGMRQGEVFGLAVDDVDFLRATVHIRRQVKIVGARLVFAPPKRGKERDIPLPESVSLRLAAHIAEYPPIAVTLPWKHPDGDPVTANLIFYTRERKALNRNYFNTYIWKPALTAASVPTTRDNGFHALRHHFASVLLSDGVDIRSLAAFLGHQDPGFTLRTYTHLMPSGSDRMRKAVDRALNGEAADGPIAAQTVGE